MRVLLIGTGPYPLGQGAIVTGPSIRTRQFAEPMIAAGHEVHLALLEPSRRRQVSVPGITSAQAFTPDELGDSRQIGEAFDLPQMEAIIGVGSLLPAAAAGRIARHANQPCWVDFFGDPLAELHAVQSRSPKMADATLRDHIWKLMREALLAGDAFSTVSIPQRHAMLGQLGLLGRFLNDPEATLRIAEIPCGVPDDWVEDNGRAPFPQVLRERGFAESTRFVLFGGSWNAWLDEESMGRAIETALERDPELHFVSCGISTGDIGESIRRRLFERVEHLRPQGRIVELEACDVGPESELLSWADVCLSMDRAIPESELGSRNRLLSMIRWGARPVVTTEAAIERELIAADLATGVSVGDHQRAAAEIIATTVRTVEKREADRVRGLQWLRRVTFGVTMQPVLTWLDNGAPRWLAADLRGLVDQWADFPADPERLFGEPPGKRSWLRRFR